MTFGRMLVSGLAFAACATLAQAQDYPKSPITLVNPYAAGGPADLLARTIAAGMSEQLGQQVVILNKPGAAILAADRRDRDRRRRRRHGDQLLGPGRGR